ncbi:Hypp7077 [Branchiostoma lanceolatum]|uniref:Hypp7077 protein n=1 Tax=Branchiostoma lanceolatum TaxID=7740 RepID=A0A8K0EBL7_BRALA|nr:Hypp7077 [Branchiostoma lanceolatum]
MCSLARRPSQDDTPGGLRPKTRPPTLLESLSGAPSTAVVTEDRVFNSIIFLDAVSAFSNAHSDVSPGCRVLMRMPVSQERKFGMGYWEAIRCERCGFTRPRQKMYEEGERIPGHTRGPLPGKKNAQLALGLTKVPVGAASVHTLFCSVELSLPTKSSLHNLSTGMAGPLISVAEQALADNRSTLRTVMQLRGDQVEDGKPVAVAAAADGVFNNPCYKGYHQKSTQRYLRSTNCVEAMHRCMHKSLPKYLLFKKLAEMRAFSAVHSAAVGGVGESIARLGQHFGVGPRSGGEAARRLLQIDRQAHSDKRRQQSDEHRRKRKKTSLSQPSKRVEKIMPETPAPACHLRYEDEHSYLQP